MTDDHEIQSSPKAEAIVNGAISVACAGAAVWIGFQLGWPRTFDVNDVDFVNPLSIMVLALAGGCLWFAAKALRAVLRQRAFGSATVVLDAPGHLRPGQPLSGRLKVQKPVAATGPFRLELTCFDVHEFNDNGRLKTSDFPVWSDARTLPPDTDAVQGLPFRFVPPASVGPDPVASGLTQDRGNSHRMTVHIPGMRQVVSGNIPPVARYWRLVATAPTKGPDFRAAVAIPVDDRTRKGRLP